MTKKGDLARLAALAGLVPSYTDAWGNERHAPEPTQQLVLRAMGLPADAPDEVEARIREIEEAPYRRTLEPVIVARHTRGTRVQVPVVLPARRPGAPIEWRFEMESGAARDGRAEFRDLPLTGERAIDGEKMERRALTLPFPAGPGYHAFRLFLGGEAGGEAATPVIVVPPRCYLPRPDAGTRHLWGIALQLYALRSERDWGIGDFTNLESMVRVAAGLGASAVGLNPLHALFPSNPLHASPYSPSHREFLGIPYIDVEAVPDLAECEEAQRLVQSPELRARLEALRGAPFVDYQKVAAAKRPVLEALYRSFRRAHLGDAEGQAGDERAAAFRRFQRLKGRSLEHLGRFQAIAEHVGQDGAWSRWPAAYRDPESPEVDEFARAHRERVEFFQYLQWNAELQLAAASRSAKDAGMAIGLYHDLALAPDGNGAEAWAHQSMFARGVTLGAPPDDWNHKGQNWGLPPYNPLALRAAAYRPFSAVIRANMNNAGALRMDHAMGLERMFWIPEGAGPQDGAYVRYPVADLIGVLALESQRQKCVVIGEDLGTLPQGFQERMRAASMLSFRLLYFSQDRDGAFLPPGRYPAPAVVAVGTHDLATLAGYWRGRDLEVRAELGLYPSETARTAARERRARERRELIRALQREGLLSAGRPEDEKALSFEVVTAVHRFLARTPARLLLLHLEDVFGEVDQVNMPGTVSEHPNWKRRLPVELERLAQDPRLLAVAAAIAEERAHARRSRRGRGRRTGP